MRKAKPWHYALGVFITITSVYAGAATIGLEIPRPAWISEVQAAERKIDALSLRVENMQLSSLRRTWSDVVSRIAELEAKGVTVPSRLKIQEETIRIEMQEQKEYVNKLRRSRQ